MMNEINLSTILEVPTIQRPENNVEQEVENFDLSSLGFEDNHEETFDQEEHEEQEVKKAPEEGLKIGITPGEAREGAELFIDFLETINELGLTRVARWRMTKKRGGKAVIKKMQSVFEKSFSDIKLTPEEQESIWKYEAYLRDKEEVEGNIPFTEKEREKLVKNCTVYFKYKNIKFAGGNSFWIDLMMIEGMKIMDVVTA